MNSDGPRVDALLETCYRIPTGEKYSMPITRREAIALLAGAVPALRAVKKTTQDASALPIAPGPFQGIRESLAAYRVPDWFRDAKFGIWAHWGPQSSVEAGDWYARNMYIQGERQYKYHLEHFGHPNSATKTSFPHGKAKSSIQITWSASTRKRARSIS
jgi:alpha-L-fucosidase